MAIQAIILLIFFSSFVSAFDSAENQFSPKWSKENIGKPTIFFTYRDTVFVGTDNLMAALSRKDGTILWRDDFSPKTVSAIRFNSDGIDVSVSSAVLKEVYQLSLAGKVKSIMYPSNDFEDSIANECSDLVFIANGQLAVNGSIIVIDNELYGNVKEVICYKTDILFITSDNAIHFIDEKSKSILWTREESLIEITQVIHLDVSSEQKSFSLFEALSEIVEFGKSMFHKFVEQLFRRLHLDYGYTSPLFHHSALVIAITNSNTVFAFDSLTGNLKWKYFFKGIQNSDSISSLFFDRSHSFVYAVFSSSTTSVVTLSAFDGKLIEEKQFPFHAIHSTLFKENNNIVLFEKRVNVVFMHSSSPLSSSEVENIFFCDVSKKDRILSGFSNPIRIEPNTYKLAPLWKSSIPNSDETILSLSSSSSSSSAFATSIQYAGIALIDRSAKQKYLNPNLLTIVTQNTQTSSVIKLYFFDSVSGMCIRQYTQIGSGKSFTAISENIVIASFLSGKEQRIMAVELFEDGIVWDKKNITAFSKREIEFFDRSFNLPFEINAFSVSQTNKGVTNRHAFFASYNGLVYSLDLRFLNPRRTELNPNDKKKPIDGIPFSPLLPLSPFQVINPFLPVKDIRQIYSSGSPSESTSRVSVFGFDLFHSALVVDKPYDKLSTDFDVVFLTITLVVCSVLVLITSHMSKRKELNQKWL